MLINGNVLHSWTKKTLFPFLSINTQSHPLVSSSPHSNSKPNYLLPTPSQIMLEPKFKTRGLKKMKSNNVIRRWFWSLSFSDLNSQQGLLSSNKSKHNNGLPSSPLPYAYLPASRNNMPTSPPLLIFHSSFNKTLAGTERWPSFFFIFGAQHLNPTSSFSSRFGILSSHGRVSSTPAEPISLSSHILPLCIFVLGYKQQLQISWPGHHDSTQTGDPLLLSSSSLGSQQNSRQFHPSASSHRGFVAVGRGNNVSPLFSHSPSISVFGLQSCSPHWQTRLHPKLASTAIITPPLAAVDRPSAVAHLISISTAPLCLGFQLWQHHFLLDSTQRVNYPFTRCIKRCTLGVQPIIHQTWECSLQNLRKDFFPFNFFMLLFNSSMKLSNLYDVHVGLLIFLCRIRSKLFNFNGKFGCGFEI